MNAHGTKTVRAVAIKAGEAAGLAEGQVTALVSVYGIKDTDGDVVPEGAFDAWVARIKSGQEGMPPVIWHHKHDDPNAYIGDVVDLNPSGTATLGDGVEVKGLEATMQFDMDDAAGRKAYDNVARGRTKEWSHAWRAETRERTKDGNVLGGMSLLEVSPVLAGSNRMTRTLAVKAEGGDPDAGTPFEAFTDWLAENLDPDTLDTLGNLTPEQRAQVVVMLGGYADACEGGADSMVGMYAGTTDTKAEPELDTVRRDLLALGSAALT